MINKIFVVQVSGIRESEKSIGALVDLIYNENGDCFAASRLIWFPKSLCALSEVEIKNGLNQKKYYISAPEWLLKLNKIKYNEK